MTDRIKKDNETKIRLEKEGKGRKKFVKFKVWIGKGRKSQEGERKCERENVIRILKMGKWGEMKTREKTQGIKRENHKKKEDVKCENIRTA